MASLNSSFEELLGKIEPNGKIQQYAQKAHVSLTDHLKSDREFGEFVENSFLYGSYKRHTAVGDIEDIDICLITNFKNNDSSLKPIEVLKNLKASISNFYELENNTEIQRKSVKVKDALPDNPSVEISLDVLPAIAPYGEDGVLLVPDKELETWVKSDPKAHLAYATNLNSPENSSGRYIPLVKLMKWWWKYQKEERWPGEKHKPKGFWVECLTGLFFSPNKENWGESFIAVLEGIENSYGNASDVPALPDPGLPGESIKTKMTYEDFQDFIEVVKNSLDLARHAYSENDSFLSSKLWQSIFGDKFPLSEGNDGPESKLANPSVGIKPHRPYAYVE